MFSFPLIHCDFVVQIVLSVGPNANFIRPITKRKWTRRKWTIRTIRNAHSEELLDHHTLVRHKVLTLPKSSRYGRHKLKVNEEASAENNSGGHHLFITQRDGNSLFLVAKGFKWCKGIQCNQLVGPCCGRVLNHFQFVYCRSFWISAEAIIVSCLGPVLNLFAPWMTSYLGFKARVFLVNCWFYTSWMML